MLSNSKAELFIELKGSNKDRWNFDKMHFSYKNTFKIFILIFGLLTKYILKNFFWY